MRYEKADSGAFFSVYLFDDFVVKVPRRDAVKDQKILEFIATTQTMLSEKVKGVLPCYRFNDVLIMPRAKGVRGDKLKPEQAKRVSELKTQGQAKIKELGYILGDLNRKNIIYNEEEDILYFIDFHKIKRYDPEQGKKGRRKNR